MHCCRKARTQCAPPNTNTSTSKHQNQSRGTSWPEVTALTQNPSHHRALAC